MKHTVELICIGDALETIALRASFDWWGIDGRLHLIGKASDLVALLDGSYPLAQHVALMCHGVPEGIVLPELGEEFAARERYNRYLSPQDVAEFANLPGSVVLNTGCVTGTQAFADAFLQHGATHYIAPTDYPEGDAALFFALCFYYYHLIKRMSLEDAFSRARSADEETHMFRLFQ